MSSGTPRGFWSLSTSPTLVFRLVLAALTLSTGIGVTYALVNRSAFQASFPGAATPSVYAGLLLAGVAGIVALLGLWAWRRWAVVLYGGLAVTGFVLDIIARAPLVHQITVVVGALIVFGLIYRNRSKFRLRGLSAG